MGDMVMLNAKNLRSPRPMKKLDDKTYSPFRIKRKIGLQAYKLQLLETFRIHDVFHMSLLQKQADGTRMTTPPPPTMVTNQDREQAYYEVEEIVGSRMVRQQLKYQVKWKGYTEVTLEPATVIQDDMPEMVKQFHTRYPFAPGP